MIWFRALLALAQAGATFLLVIYPAKLRRGLEKDIEEYEDEIYRLGVVGDPVSLLRIETIAKRRDRAVKSLRALRSAIGDAD